MRKGLTCSIVIGLMFFFIGNVFGFDDTSFRLKSMGSELKWIITDEYTDVFQNPASINDLSSNWLFTNLSNQTGNLHQFLNYGNNNYQGSSGSYLLGGFRQLLNWKVGLIFDYWKDKRWNSKGYEMNTNFSENYYFSWNNHGDGEGTWITDYNNGTETKSDDYRVIEEKHGTEYDADNSGLNFKFILGKKIFGLGYEFSQYASNHPFGSNNPQYAFHSYTLMEVGTNSPKEAVTAIQKEVNEYTNETFIHTFSLGAKKDLNSDVKLDAVGSLVYVSEKNNYESRRKKQIDFDPDNDGVSFESYPYYRRYYDQYSYQGLSTYKGNLSGWGYQFDGRCSKRLSDIICLKLIGQLDYLPLKTDHYLEQSTTQESMTAFTQGNEFSDSYEMKRFGTLKEHNFSSLVGFGGSFQPSPELLWGFGIKWYHNFNESIYDLLSHNDANNNIYKQESKIRLNLIALPIGFEYRLKEKYAFRLGANTYFYSWKTTKAFTGSEESDSYTQEQNIKSAYLNSYNTTSYSYGFGYEVNKNMHLDIAGITNLTDISNLYLSLILTY